MLRSYKQFKSSYIKENTSDLEDLSKELEKELKKEEKAKPSEEFIIDRIVAINTEDQIKKGELPSNIVIDSSKITEASHGVVNALVDMTKIKTGDSLYLTAYMKPATGNAFSSDKLGVVKVKVQEIYKGVSYLKFLNQ